MLKAQAGFHEQCTAEEQRVQLELVASSGITVISARARQRVSCWSIQLIF